MKRLIILLIVSFIFIAVYGPEAKLEKNFSQNNNVSNLPATRGAIFEALFILQNRKNNISDLKSDVILSLEKAELNINELFNQKSEISKSLAYYEIYKSNIIKGLYNDYLKEIILFEQEINDIVDYVNQQSVVSDNYLKLAVQNGNLIKDILDERANLINIAFKVSKEELDIDHQKNILANRQKKLNLLKEKSSANLAQLNFLEKVIKKLKKDFDKSQKSINLKRQNLSKIKGYLAKLEEEYYRYDNFRKMRIFPKNWFLARLEKLQNCNRKSNFVGLV